MPFQVELTPEAEDQLALIWLNASDRAAVTRAENALHRLLAADPKRGRYLSEGLYTMHLSPLTVFYEVMEGEGLVAIADIRT